jgi:E3 ubiquitin-protein ligase TRIP12
MLQSYIKQKREIYADSSKSSAEKATTTQNIEVDGAKLEDLCLDFTLPGDESYELKAGGSDIPVTINNIEEYIELLQDIIAGSGISQQVAAFREGFNCLFAIDDLRLLTYSELVSLFGKAEEDWSYATLADTIRADHGFTMESDPVRYLLEILSSLNDNEKRQFLQFTTGSPRLPIGGWKALRPVFTVVRKIPEAPLQADDYLPSVMTCANYLKMPAYTSKEIMLRRLLTSMNEGQNSFLLS